MQKEVKKNKERGNRKNGKRRKNKENYVERGERS